MGIKCLIIKRSIFDNNNLAKLVRQYGHKELDDLGFLERFTLSHVPSTMFFIISGSPQESLSGKLRLRQGNTISSYYFVLSMES